MSMLNQRFHHCLSQCKQLNVQSLAQQLGDANAAQLTADKLLYNHAIELVSRALMFNINFWWLMFSVLIQCQSAALDELFGNPASCCRRYQTAHILFHSLGQQVTQQADKTILNKCKPLTFVCSFIEWTWPVWFCLILPDFATCVQLHTVNFVFLTHFYRSRSRWKAPVCVAATRLHLCLRYYVTCQKKKKHIGFLPIPSSFSLCATSLIAALSLLIYNQYHQILLPLFTLGMRGGTFDLFWSKNRKKNSKIINKRNKRVPREEGDEEEDIKQKSL